MTDRFKTIRPAALKASIFKLIDQDWMLITAGTAKSWNTMTASWGGLGTLWNKPVAFAFVRPTRFTCGFMERSEQFTLSFFAARYRKALAFCGSHSGRDVDKARETGLEPLSPVPGVVSFRQTRMVLVCRKLYTTDIDPARFLDPGIDKLYPKKDYHRVYVGEVVRLLRAGR